MLDELHRIAYFFEALPTIQLYCHLLSRNLQVFMILWLRVFVCFQCWRKLSIFTHAFTMPSCLISIFVLFFPFLFVFGDGGSKHGLIFDVWHKFTDAHCNGTMIEDWLEVLIGCFGWAWTVGEAVPKIPFGKCLIFILNDLADLVFFLLIQCLILFLIIFVVFGTGIPARYYFMESSYFLFPHGSFIFIPTQYLLMYNLLSINSIRN